MVDKNPPLFDTFKSFFDVHQPPDQHHSVKNAADECELPLIDLNLLNGASSKDCCKREIVRASAEWGFFQVVNHDTPAELLARMRSAMVNIFRRPFEKKEREELLDFAADSYRWGTPTATSLKDLSWSEAYHIALSSTPHHKIQSTRNTIEEFATIMAHLARRLSSILAEGLGYDGTYIQDNCTQNTCYLRLNHYPPCPVLDEVFGLIPHTDSDFLTILFQDQVGGLQLMKDERWITVKPNPNALIINIGDLFQAWSNGAYKSVEHRVMANPKLERFSVAYFLCPSYDTMIQSHKEPSIYRKFTFKEYRQQVQEDVRLAGHKIGLPRFLKTRW